MDAGALGPGGGPGDDGGAVFEREALIRFSHCDPASTVFFPHYLTLFNGLVEDWFDHGLGLGYAHVVGTLHIGLPTVSLQCEFTAPSRMGETVTLGLRVQRVGGKSITLALGCRLGRQVRVKATQVIVTTQLESNCPIDVPPFIRKAIARFEAGAAQKAD